MKNFAVFLLCLFSIGSAVSQSDWNTLGNNTSSGNFVGTLNNQPLDFRTNNTTRMRIMQGTGALGIGASGFAPSALLHVNLLSLTPNNGNVFRTDGPMGQDVVWSMYTGTTVQDAEQRARFLLSPNTLTQEWNPLESNTYNASENHLRVESTLGDIVFRAHGAQAFQGPSGILAERMRISSVPYDDPHIGGTRSTTRVSISSRPENEIVNPLAMLHMGDKWNYQTGGHREWMNSGTYIQRKTDNVFFGMRPREKTDVLNDDFNDAIIAWGDNDTPDRLDALRVVFCGLYSGSAEPGEAAHMDGLETMRIHPGGNIGMGDFSVNGLDEKPTEKLDIVGKLRVRDVPENTIPDVLIVGRQMDDVGDYVHSRLPFPDDNSVFLSGTGEWIQGVGADCRWLDVASVTKTGELDLNMGFQQSDPCYRGKLGVGVAINKDAKMEVHNYFEQDSVRTALLVKSRGDWDGEENNVTGILSIAHGTYMDPISDKYNTYTGLSASGFDGGYTVGVRGGGGGSTNQTNILNIGVYASAYDGIEPTGSNIGLYAQGGDYSIIAFGAVASVSSPITLSDESVKTDVQPIENALEILDQLEPMSYNMINPEGRELNFDDDRQFGFLAEDVQSILPDVVEDFLVPDRLDTNGFVPETHLNLKGIQYQAFIPLLVAGFKEQNSLLSAQSATIEAQNETIASLQDQLLNQASQIEEIQENMAQVMASLQQAKSDVNNCCENYGATGHTGQGAVENEGVVLEQNIPNPFDRSTLITFEIPQDAQVRLEISDAAGRVIDVIRNERMQAGRHDVQWNASEVPSGLYHYSIYVDTVLLTKRMIKL